MRKPAAAFACIATLGLTAAPASASAAVISVNGTGAAGVPAGAGNATQQAAYSRALSGAIDDARAKAAAVAQQLSLTLGTVQSVTELSSDYLGYCGIGFVVSPQAIGISGAGAPSKNAAASMPANQLKPIPPKHRKHKSNKRAHKAQTESACQVEADVTLVYATG